ncbi:hypothetical protein CDL15_Pgr012262 [Punica granatum]|uniref:Uncharacterized protein n=1 Tax=Punica granatum TaxID=22663 RepID=A0A218WTK8_PUNGR|nr:hypothetical protein CDL15_Pgr012262 [Punica granatum]
MLVFYIQEVPPKGKAKGQPLRLNNYNKKYGFVVDILSFWIFEGLTRETVCLVSKLKEEPDWMLEFRLKAFDKLVAIFILHR